MEESSIAIVDIEGLQKTYRVGFWRKKVKALRGVDLKINENEIFGLLGPNGAGKTTMIKALVGLIRPDRGHAYIFNKSAYHTSIRERIGFLPENPSVYAYLTGYEFLFLCGRFFKIPDRSLRSRISELVLKVGLSSDALNKQVRTYSKGMLQRLGFAQALINEPELLLLDEPMSGLDPVGRYDIKELIKELKAEGKTILFNSHILSDVEEICDRVGILFNGEVLRLGRVEEMMKPLDNLYHLRIRGLNSVGKTNLKRLSLRLLDKGKDVTEATFNNLDTALKAVAVARQSGGNLVDLSTHRVGLEQLFIDVIREEKEKMEGTEPR